MEVSYGISILLGKSSSSPPLSQPEPDKQTSPGLDHFPFEIPEPQVPCEKGGRVSDAFLDSACPSVV